MKRELKYRLGFRPSHLDLLHRMRPNRIIGSRVGEFCGLVDDPLVRERIFAEPDIDGYFCSMHELFFHFEPEEIERATLFQLYTHRNFVEITYDERTRYDESNCCPEKCGYGRVQLGPIVLPQLAKRRMPPLALIAGGQYLCTKECAQEVLEVSPTVKFVPVFSSKRRLDSLEAQGQPFTSSSDIAAWVDDPAVVSFQLDVSPTVDLSSKTITGENPYLEGANPYPCPLGHIFGYLQLSPLYFKSRPEFENFTLTCELWGHHGDSVFWPNRVLLTNKELGQFFLKKKVKYFDVIPVYDEDGEII